MTDKITAPWTPDQVDRLNRFQRLGYVHPFTCQNSHDGADRTLVATKAGWICPHCDYRQDWAHAMMLEVPPDTLAGILKTFGRRDVLADRLRHAVTTATNDDFSEPRSVKRDRHVGRIDAMRDAIEFLIGPAREAELALEESVKLQSHYAGILNNYDEGTRLEFANVDEWIARLRVTGALK